MFFMLFIYQILMKMSSRQQFKHPSTPQNSVLQPSSRSNLCRGPSLDRITFHRIAGSAWEIINLARRLGTSLAIIPFIPAALIRGSTRTGDVRTADHRAIYRNEQSILFDHAIHRNKQSSILPLEFCRNMNGNA